MKNHIKTSILIIFSIISLAIMSCKKDNPVPEVNQEEFDKTVLTFVELEEQGGHIHELETALTVTFDASGKPDKSHYHIHTGHKYRLYISLYSGGELVNDEILDEASSHQFFFTGAPEGVIDYTYEDNIGLKGIFEVLKESPQFNLNVVLRHGIKKTTPLLPFNSPLSEYTKHGGADDLNITFQLHPGDDH